MSDSGDEDNAICSGLDGIYSSGIHVVALFVVLAASLVGALFPLLGRRVPALRLPDYVYAVGKCTGTGVMLAVGLIHMMGEAAENFDAPCVPEGFKAAYEAWAFLLAGIAMLLMHALDTVIGEVVHGWYERREKAAAAAGKFPDEAEEEEERDSGCGHSHAHSPDLEDLEGLEGMENPLGSKGAVVGAVPCSEHGCEGHQHGVAVPESMGRVQRVVAAVCMEFGVTLHSVLVGLDLGVTSNDEVRVLMVALLFHQLFEGLAMGARLADASFHLSLEVVLMLVFSLSAPIGVGVGIAAITSSPTALSGSTYVMVASILDAVCGGILVYLALTLMLVDFPKDLRRLCSSDNSYSLLRKLGLFAGLWVGAAVMMLIGKWC